MVEYQIMNSEIKRSIDGNTYTVSAANIPGLDPRIALKGASAYITPARSAGFDGIEWWPIKPGLTMQLITHQLKEDEAQYIFSGHQSPRTENTRDVVNAVFQTVRTQSLEPLVGVAKPIVGLPSIEDSVPDLVRLKKRVGNHIDVVLYSTTPPDFYHEFEDFRNRLIQVDPDLTERWKVKSVQGFIDAMDKNGFETGDICLDLNHLLRKGKEGNASPFANWRESMPAFLKTGRVQSMHLAIGRTDLPAVDARTSIMEIQDMMKGTDDTEIVSKLRLINGLGWRGQIILEVLPSAIGELEGIKGNLPLPILQTYYRGIRERLGEIFEFQR